MGRGTNLPHQRIYLEGAGRESVPLALEIQFLKVLGNGEPSFITGFSAIGNHFVIGVQTRVMKENQMFHTGFGSDVTGDPRGQMPVFIWVFDVVYTRRGFADKKIGTLRRLADPLALACIT